ncbi:hypothetical protein EPA93_01480 [Ktedonosporobacter rubrisoli]|uniref:B3/B4 tRNA-binding domain-containing protein n=1 Tax=Ktedonosporobacter rubrisoli TaxID=2509675 RepID=A0A4V0YY24_KTERU|nr:phenylalanine--tRNA ligase beta subunit-related protein [Ktedonosporobacter rubrisoli]QBD74731.1 hypothetical protein EPA93_01480 [Ktedonosporobacter rubrisoli]
MHISIAPEIFTCFPGIRVIALTASGLDNQREQQEIRERWQAAWERAAEEVRKYGNAQSHPHVQPWREHFRALGVSAKKFPNALEALLRRAFKGDAIFYINPLVDFYNAVSLEYLVPVGGFDLAMLPAPLEIRLTRAGDSFQALDEDISQTVPAGEVAYVTGSTILTRHLMWRQARTALLTSTTHSAVLVAEVPGVLGAEVAENVRQTLQEGLQSYFGVAATGFILDKARPQASW